MQRKSWHMCAVGAAVLAVTGFTQSASASFTDIDPPAGGELGHNDVLDQIYGGSFTASGLDFVGGGPGGNVDAIRIMDDDAGGDDDQIWQFLNTPIGARAEARFAKDPQAFGYVPGDGTDPGDDPESDFVKLFDVTGSGFNVSGSAGFVDLSHLAAFRWARQGPGTITHTSREDDNPDGLDHMVTYKIEGLDRLQPVFLLFFEDDFRDWDFQDLVVEVAAVPSPAAIGPGLALLGMLGLTRRRRNRE